MKATAINGSPRKNWNTAALLENALHGCSAQGASVTLIHLYDYSYQGCRSCFACKRIGGESYGRCGQRDDLSLLLEHAMQTDVLILGSPLYFHVETGEMRSFMERLLFPSLSYASDHGSILHRSIRTALIYTMNARDDAEMAALHQDASVHASQTLMTRIFGSCEVLLSFDTCQFDDYSKYAATAWSPEAKARRRRQELPRDCRLAYELGARLVAEA